MIQSLKKSFAVLGAVALLASAMSPVFATVPAKSPKNGGDQGGTIDIQYLGARVCRVAGTTTASLCSNAGAHGMLYALCAFGTSAVAGKGAMAFDSGIASGFTTFDPLDSFVQTYVISPLVVGTSFVQTSANTLAHEGVVCWKPPVPARYESGFVMRLNDASLIGIALVRPDTGANP